jgi:hypothetical protein
MEKSSRACKAYLDRVVAEKREVRQVAGLDVVLSTQRASRNTAIIIHVKIRP